MTWEHFEQTAARYEAWYETRAGRRVSQAERLLIRRLLRQFPASASTLEIGCGTAHFTKWLAEGRLEAFGLDRSPAMLAEAQRLARGLPLVRADAQRLPVGDRCVDLAFLITTLEFLASPFDALQEAVRIARRGVIVVALNRWSIGGLSRRWGRKAKGELLRHAQDFSLPRLRAMLRRAAKHRLREVRWASAVFPAPFHEASAPIPFGEVVAITAALEEAPEWDAVPNGGSALLSSARISSASGTGSRGECRVPRLLGCGFRDAS
jgi:SAM-dependent methyltransferase